jgi:arabinose-5-phosphate isomerase
VVLEIGRIDEACPMGLVPTTSSAAMHALCDAIAMTVLKNRPFGNEEYALYHPGGALGRKVMKVSELMRNSEANPVVQESEPLHRAVAVMTDTPGKPGSTSVVDRQGRLVGVFTDGDLRRLVERRHTDFSLPVSSVMGRAPRTCSPDDLVRNAASRMREAKVDQLIVVDGQGHPVGLLDIQDLLAARFL